MGFISKWRAPKKQVAMFDHSLGVFDLKTMVARTAFVVEDRFTKRGFEIPPNTRTITFKKNGKVIGRGPVIDEARGVGVNIEPDENLLKIKTNPELFGQMIDAVLITMAYSLNPSNKKVIIAGVLAFLIGLVFGRGM